jgi:hypothetical protein
MSSFLTISTPTQAAVNKDSFRLTDAQRFTGLDSAENMVVWQIEGDTTIRAADPRDRQVLTVAAAAAGQGNPYTNGQVVVWRMCEDDDQCTIQGKNMETNTTFTVSEAPEQIRHLVPLNGYVAWVRIDEGTSELVVQRIDSDAAQRIIVSTANRIERVVASGTRLLWNEVPVDGDSLLKLADVSSTTAPTTVAEDSQISGFALHGDQFAWIAEMNQKPSLFTQRLGDDSPILVASDVNGLTLAQNQLLYVERTSTADQLQLRNLQTGTTTTLANNPVRFSVGRETACWTTASNDDRSNRQIFCRNLRDQQSTPLPFSSNGVSDFLMINESLVWSEASLPNPSSPRTLYAAPISELLEREVPLGDTQAFERLWQRHDKPVADQNAERSWTWGPAPLAEALEESYSEGSNGKRLVLYHEKSRMEITDASADANATWYVSNGLLPIELITGRMQTGNSRFEEREPAEQTAIGDPGQFPTYANLSRIYQSPGQVSASEIGQPITRLFNADGTISEFSEFSTDPNTTLAEGQNGHGIAQAFRTFMNQQGIIYESGQLRTAALYDPLFVFGLPITSPHWVKVKLGGTERPVLFQCFERRCLTYNPANAANWRVEMGNVGQHYYAWRYGD